MGRGRYWALLDTGSNRTVVSHRLGGRFPTVRRSTMRSVFRELETRIVRIPSIEVLGKQYERRPAVVRPRASDSVLSWTLLLGTDVLLDRRLTVDFRARRVEAGRRGPSARSGGSVPLRCARGRPFVRARLGGRPVVAFVDTGSPLCSLNPNFGRAGARSVRKERITDGSGARSWEPVYRGPRLTLGPWDLGRPEFTRESMAILERFFRTRVDMVLGCGVLRAAGGAWTFERRQGWLGWSPTAAPGRHASSPVPQR